MSTSRPPSLALMPPSSACSNSASPPPLRDILTNAAAPPYTLSAFTAFLSQNHCMETLEFTMDADRYTTVYFNCAREQALGFENGIEHVASLWQKIISAYIVPYGHREVNLPAHVRDRLLSLPNTPIPPHPSELDEAVRIVYELMNDSVLGPFLASVAVHHEWAEENPEDPRHVRTRLRIPREFSQSSDDSGRSPRVGFLPMLNMAWTSEPKSSASSSNESADRGLTDGSANTPSPGANEPMTPPTTPPVSDWEFNTSPGGLVKSPNGHSSSWKKMSAKLGFGRMNRSKRGHSSSATSVPVEVVPIPDDDVTIPSGCAPSVKPRTVTDEAQSEKPSPRTSGDWEEPHPGQRYSIATKGTERPSVSVNTHGNGVVKVGMAAKAYSPYYARAWSSSSPSAPTAARRFAPVRLRNSSHRPSKLPHNSSKTPTYTTNTDRSTPTNTSPTLSVPRPSHAPTPSPLCGCPLYLNRIASSSPKPPSPATTVAETPSSPSSSSAATDDRMSLTDFSGFLRPALTTTTTATTTSSVDTGSCMSVDVMEKPAVCPATADDLMADPDPYGWEAELEKRVTPPTCEPGGVGLGLGLGCPGAVESEPDYNPVLQYRRAGGQKKTLLQRVLSFGGPGTANHGYGRE
ncbi:hypothetical protein B0J18DRAFT_480738 [Chaetomium sp. MPI-SDFR-AT-0129]|nr:hypothetical protein B0J18DRAFT_480738 [Chaetomium sp. MPI-SDFR-AT-0129]